MQSRGPGNTHREVTYLSWATPPYVYACGCVLGYADKEVKKKTLLLFLFLFLEITITISNKQDDGAFGGQCDGGAVLSRVVSSKK